MPQRTKFNMGALPSSYHAEIDQVSKSEWSELLQQFDDASIYQTWSYGAVRWGEDHLSHLVVKEGEETIGLAQLSIVKVPILRVGIAYIPWGPLWQKKGKENRCEDLGFLIAALCEEYAVKRGLLLRIAPNVIEDGVTEIQSIIKDRAFQFDSSVIPYRTLMVDLTPPLDELRKRLAQKWRNQLNRAEKNRLKVIEGDSEELYQAFLILQKEMLARKEYVPGVDYDEFGEIQKDLPKKLKMRIMLCEYEGEPVAAAICSAIGDTGIYLLGAMGDKGTNLKGSYLLQWRAIRWLKENGCHWYDLGGIDPAGNPGVHHFKAGLGGKDVVHVGQFEFWTNSTSAFVVSVGYRFKDMMRKMKQIKSMRK